MGEFDHVVAAVQSSPIVRALSEMTEAGDFSALDRNGAKRHHFLPQFLLRGFAHPHKGNERLFQMERSNRGAPIRVDVRTAASRRRLYTALDSTGQPSNRNEGYLALIESHAAPALRRLIADPTSLSPADRATTAFFVAVQAMRTPAAAEQVTEVANAAFQTAASEFLSDRRAFAAHHRGTHGAADDHDIDRLRVDMLDQVRSGGLRLSGDGGAAFGAALEHAVSNVPMVFAFDWTLLRAPSGGLLTSDRGITIHDPTPPFPWTAHGLLSSENSETLIPLSDEYALVLQPGSASAGLAVREISPREAETFNLRVFAWAEKYVFGKTQESLARIRVASRRRPADVIPPKPFCQVALIERDPDDPSLAEDNERRGWPAHLRNASGRLYDYMVIPTDAPHPELWKRADELTERRARKRVGAGPDDALEGRIRNDPLHPLDLSR